MKGRYWVIMQLCLGWRYQISMEKILEAGLGNVESILSYTLPQLINGLKQLLCTAEGELWFEGCMQSSKDVASWDDFIKGICMRFSSKKKMWYKNLIN